MNSSHMMLLLIMPIVTFSSKLSTLNSHFYNIPPLTSLTKISSCWYMKVIIYCGLFVTLCLVYLLSLLVLVLSALYHDLHPFPLTYLYYPPPPLFPSLLSFHLFSSFFSFSPSIFLFSLLLLTLFPPTYCLLFSHVLSFYLLFSFFILSPPSISSPFLTFFFLLFFLPSILFFF